jgi:hypothetical protein
MPLIEDSRRPWMSLVTGFAAEGADRAAEAQRQPEAHSHGFLRRRARRGRVVAAAGLALVAVLGAAVLVAGQQPQDRETVAPAGGVMRVPQQGFELPVPAGWKVKRQLTGTDGASVVGVALLPRSGQPPGAAITVAATADREVAAGYMLDLQRSTSQRADGRLYKLRPGRAGHNASGGGPVGPYAIAWPAWPPLPAATYACRVGASLRAGRLAGAAGDRRCRPR